MLRPPTFPGQAPAWSRLLELEPKELPEITSRVNDSNCFCFRFALCTPHFCVRLLTSSGWSETCSRRVGPDHTKFFLATQDFFRLDHRQSFWPKHRPKLLPEPTQRSRALTSHCTLLRNLLRTVTRLQVTAHCCVKLLRTVTRLQVTAQTAA